MTEYKSGAAIAEDLGRSPQVIQRICRQFGVKHVSGKGYPVDDVMAAVKKASANNTRAPLEDGDPRRKKVELENRVLEIKIAEAEGRLVDAEEVSQAWFRIGAAIRNDLIAMPAAIAPRLIGKTDPSEIAAVIDGCVRDALRHISDKVPGCDTSES